MKEIEIIGFDPSLTNWGIAKAILNLETLEVKITDISLISTKKEKKRGIRVSSDRLRRGQELAYGVGQAIQNTKIIFSEVPTGSQSASSAFGLGIATGLLSAIPFPIIQILPVETKLIATGKKTATKAEMIEWAMKLYPDLPWFHFRNKPSLKNEHIADAIAVIHAGLKTDQFKQLAQALSVLDD